MITEQDSKRGKSLAPVVIFVVFLLVLVNLPIIIYAVGHFFNKTNVPDVYSEIKSIVDNNEYSYIKLGKVYYTDDDIYRVTFFSKNLSTSNRTECNSLLNESLVVFDEITSQIGKASELYDKRLCIEFEEDGSTGYNITFCNYEYDFGKIKSVPGETVFDKLVSVHIDYPVDNIAAVEARRDEIRKLHLGSNCKVGSDTGGQDE